jgi:hypothetical protein
MMMANWYLLRIILKKGDIVVKMDADTAHMALRNDRFF